MSPSNVKRLRDLQNVTSEFIKFFHAKIKEKVNGLSLDVIDVLVETDLYSFDFNSLYQFFDKADLIKKLNGFIQSEVAAQQKQQEAVNKQVKEKREEPSARSILYQVREFIRILSLNPDDGQFVFHYSGQDEGKACLQYIALNPALSLKRLLDQAEKVVLASGTLEPTEEYDVLNSYINCGSDHSIIHKFSCGHVLPLDNFKCQLVS